MKYFWRGRALGKGSSEGVCPHTGAAGCAGLERAGQTGGCAVAVTAALLEQGSTSDFTVLI